MFVSIERECGIKLTVCGVSNFLKRWGFTPQKPIKKACEQSPEAVQAWLDKEYPEIERRTKAKLKAATNEHMQALEKSPERAKKFFQDARVKYAA